MKARLILVISLCLVLLSTTGCSILLAKTGRYKGLMTDSATTKELVHNRLGKPDVTGLGNPLQYYSEKNCDYEIYYVKGPVYSSREEENDKLTVLITLGILEIVCLPMQLYEKTTGWFTEYSLMFVYAPDGKMAWSESMRGQGIPKGFSL